MSGSLAYEEKIIPRIQTGCRLLQAFCLHCKQIFRAVKQELGENSALLSVRAAVSFFGFFLLRVTFDEMT